MKDLEELTGKLNQVIASSEEKTKFKTIINEVAQFYVDNLNVDEDEVAILLANKEKSMLSFAYPDFLINAGMIPMTSTDAIASNIFNTGKSVIENNLQQQKHLALFGIIRTPNRSIRPIWKMMGVLIHTEKEKLGVIEISGRASNFSEVTRDFTQNDVEFVKRTILKLAPFIKKAMPEDFRWKIG